MGTVGGLDMTCLQWRVVPMDTSQAVPVPQTMSVSPSQWVPVPHGQPSPRRPPHQAPLAYFPNTAVDADSSPTVKKAFETVYGGAPPAAYDGIAAGQCLIFRI